MRHLIDIQELSTTEIEELLRVAEDIIADPRKYAEACHGKKVGYPFLRAVHKNQTFL